MLAADRSRAGAVRFDGALRQDYQRLKFRRRHALAKVAIARKLAVRMYWMLRSGADYARLGSHARQPGRHPGERKFIDSLIGFPRIIGVSEEGIMVGSKVTE